MEEEQETAMQGIMDALGQVNTVLQGLQTAGAGLVTTVQALATQVQQQHQAPPQLPPPAPVIFAIAPLAHTPQGQLLDYGTKEGIKIHSTATRPLFPDDEYFDVDAEEFRSFMTYLNQRCKDLGFTEAPGGICLVPPDAAHPNVGDRINTVEDFGRATLAQIEAWERTFLAATAGAQGRLAQDSKILYDLLWASLSAKGTARIEIWRHQYSFEVGGVIRNSGGCLLKVIIRESYLDSNATASSIRLQLSSLDTWIRENGTDIIDYNAHVRALVDGLKARGETTEDLLINYIKGLKACPDVAFKTYITAQENGHEDGTATLTPDLLMERACNYYKKRLNSPTDKWDSKLDPEAALLAMQARLAKVEKQKQHSVTFKEGGGKGKGKGKGKSGDKPKPQKAKDPSDAKPSWLVLNENVGNTLKRYDGRSRPISYWVYKQSSSRFYKRSES